MIEFGCPSCGKVLRAEDGHVGKRAKCKACGAAVTVPGSAGPAAENRAIAQAEPAPPIVLEPKLWEYKVLTQKDKWFSGKFDPEKVEGALNAYAKQGWRMRGIATASVPGFGGSRDEVIFVLER